MRKTIYTILTISLFACNSYKPIDNFLLPDNKEINDVIEAIIYQDCLPVVYTDSNREYVSIMPPLSADLVKYQYTFFPHQNDSGFFCSSDTSYIKFQNDTLKEFHIDKSLLSKMHWTTRQEIETKRQLENSIYYIEMTIPIFSLDNKKAYVRLINALGGLSGDTQAIYLEKINKKWTITRRRVLTIS